MTLINRREMTVSTAESPFTGVGWKPSPLPIDWNVADEVHQDIIATGKLRLEHLQALYHHYDMNYADFYNLNDTIIVPTGNQEVPVKPTNDWKEDLKTTIENMEVDNRDWPDEHSEEDFDNIRIQTQRNSDWLGIRKDPYILGHRFWNPDGTTGYELEYQVSGGKLEYIRMNDEDV
jgi:hypothetical protein